MLDTQATWATAVAAASIAAGLIAQIVLQVMARMEAARVASQAKGDAARAQTAAESAAAAARVALIEVKVVKSTLAEAEAVKLGKLAELQVTASQTQELVNGQKAALLAEIATLKTLVAELEAKALRRLP